VKKSTVQRGKEEYFVLTLKGCDPGRQWEVKRWNQKYKKIKNI
jgi:hypothetical protein